MYFVCDLKGLPLVSPPVTSNLAKGSEEPAADDGKCSWCRVDGVEVVQSQLTNRAGVDGTAVKDKS